MRAFPGLRNYFDYCRKEVMEKGYILLNPLIRNKAYIYDYDKLCSAYEQFTSEFWESYRRNKANREPIYQKNGIEKIEIWNDFTRNEYQIHELADLHNVNTYTIQSIVVKHFFQRKAASEKQSINYRMDFASY